jgi:hypothetical protein
MGEKCLIGAYGRAPLQGAHESGSTLGTALTLKSIVKNKVCLQSTPFSILLRKTLNVHQISIDLYLPCSKVPCMFTILSTNHSCWFPVVYGLHFVRQVELKMMPGRS